MDFLQKAAMDGASKALTEKLASVDRFADDLKTIHEDLADGIELTADKLEKLLKSLSKSLDNLNKEVKAIKAMKPPEMKMEMPDMSKIESGLKTLASVPQVDLEPVLLALDILVNRKPVSEKWTFDIQREEFSGRIETVSAERIE